MPFQLMKPKVSSLVGSQDLSGTKGAESQTSHQYMESQHEQFSLGESQDLFGTAEVESQNLDSEPESQLLFVKYKSELAAIKGKDNNFVKSFQSSHFLKFSVRPYHKQFP
jgi:hypothetical protein